MNETMKDFNEVKERNKRVLEDIRDLLEQGGNLKLNIDDVYKEKVSKALKSVDGENLKVALVGGFSEGKTSIAAAWLGKLDKKSMKISHQESSDAVIVYDLDEGLQLVDTPGLFGFKERYENGDAQKYKDITKKYVSEAHLILYILNPSNPIKESHKDDLNWLFRELNLLDRTIFVLSRFDKIADLDDEDEYKRHLRIKQDNVRGRLKDLIDLSDTEASELSIVAVAANPYDLGVDYWFENPEKFKQLSHIDTLQAATQDKIRNIGGVALIAEEAKRSIAKDIVEKYAPVAQERQREIDKEMTIIVEEYEKVKKELGKLKADAKKAQMDLNARIGNYFDGLFAQIDGSSIDTFSDFIMAEIGEEGRILERKIDSIFTETLSSLGNQIEQLGISYGNIDNLIDSSPFVNKLLVDAFGSAAEAAADYVKKNVSNKTILAARDTFASGLKLKPHGASNLAKSITTGAATLQKAVPAVIALLELYGMYKDSKKEEEFRKSKSKFKDNLLDCEEGIKSSINSEDFINNYIKDLIEKQGQIEQTLESIERVRDGLEQWSAKANKIKQIIGA